MQPAASAGPILRVAIAAGKFQGVTSTDTPIGWCSVRIRFAPDGARMKVPSMRTASSAYQRKNSAAYAASPRASRSDLPFSADISLAMDSARCVISSNALRRISPRCRGGVAAQPGSAACAAPTASSASSTLPSATSASGSSVAGSSTGNVPPPRPPPHSPPMSSPVGTSRPVSAVRSAATARHFLSRARTGPGVVILPTAYITAGGAVTFTLAGGYPQATQVRHKRRSLAHGIGSRTLRRSRPPVRG